MINISKFITIIYRFFYFCLKSETFLCHFLNILVFVQARKYDDANVKLSFQPNPSMQKTNKKCLLRKIEGKCIKILQDNLR